MCQKAPKCTDFSINPGRACPRPPYPRLPPTELAIMHSVNKSSHINSQTRCYGPEYRLDRNYFRCVKVCQVHYDPPPIMALRLLRSHGIHYVLNIASSIGATIESMTSRRQIQDGGPHDFRSKMAAPTTPRWRPHDTKMAAPVTRSVTPRRVSQRPRPREGSVTS